MEPTAKSLADGRFLGPAPRVALVACQDAEESPEQFGGYLELLPQQLQLLVEHAREGQQVVPLVLQLPADRPHPMGAQRRTALQFGHHEVVQCAAVGGARPSHSEDVVAEPADQQRNLVGQGHRGVTGSAGSAQELSGAGDGFGAPPPIMPLGAAKLPPAPLGVLDRAVGAIFQIADDLLQIADDVEDIAPTGDLGQGQGLARTEAAAGVGDGGLGIEALIDQFQ